MGVPANSESVSQASKSDSDSEEMQFFNPGVDTAKGKKNKNVDANTSAILAAMAEETKTMAPVSAASAQGSAPRAVFVSAAAEFQSLDDLVGQGVR